jgi:membrane complex biogenesis BtpA family protein
MSLDARFWQTKPVIGMLHLAPLPGSPRCAGALDAVVQRALADAEALQAGGCQALMLENFGDAPFYPDDVPAHVVAAMTRVALEVRRAYKGVLGINVLRNDARSALAIAAAVGAEMVRVNVLTGARVTDQGLVIGRAHELLRERRLLGAEGIAILADVDVKHSAALATRPLADEVKDTIGRGLADAVIVSGGGTGAAVDLGKLRAVKAAAGSAPVLIGSGATAETLADLALSADGFIVGTAFERNGIPGEVVEVERVRRLMAAHRQLGQSR